MSEPRTKAGRALLDGVQVRGSLGEFVRMVRDAILAIEAEAIILGSEKTWNLTAHTDCNHPAWCAVTGDGDPEAALV